MFMHPYGVFPLQTRFAFPTRVYLTNVPGFPRTASLLSHFSKSSLSSFLSSPSSWPCYFRIRTVYKAWQASFYHLKQIAVWVTFLMFRTLLSEHDLLIMWVVFSIAESVPAVNKNRWVGFEPTTTAPLAILLLLKSRPGFVFLSALPGWATTGSSEWTALR